MKRSLAIALFITLLTDCSHNQTPGISEFADKILIVKSTHTLSLMSNGRVFRSYKVALGRSPVGPKTRKSDHKTPEGLYTIDAKKDHSRFYRALHISYPNAQDRARAQAAGYDPGGDIEIHGIENGLGWIGRLQRRIDWTDVSR
jgi:murein L,D-transpeptidase YafK